jgi:hypothetical protein
MEKLKYKTKTSKGHIQRITSCQYILMSYVNVVTKSSLVPTADHTAIISTPLL